MAYKDNEWNLIANRDITTLIMALNELQDTVSGQRIDDVVRLVFYSDGSGHIEFSDGKEIRAFPGCTTSGCDHLSEIIEAHKTINGYINDGRKL